MKTIRLGYAHIYYTPEGCTTIFHDGSKVDATPHDIPHYHVIAHRCGYGDDIMAYCREHEVAHEVIAEFLTKESSQVLWYLAHGRVAPKDQMVYEEIAAQTLQRWARANERPIVSGVDWDRLKAIFLEAVSDEDPK